MNNIKLYIITLLLPAFAWSQQLESTVDRKTIAIGEAIDFQIKVMADSTSYVAFPDSEMMGELEVIDNFAVDTLRIDKKFQLVKKYNLTQFDSGRYVLPRQIIKIGQKDFYTDSVEIAVNNIKVDTTKKQIYDIKTVTAAKGKPERFSFKYWLWLLALIPILAVAWYFYKKRKKKIAIAKAKQLPPLEEAKKSFKALDKSGLDKQEDVKEYYSQLANIVRNYIGRDVSIPSLETTTRELIQILTKENRTKKLGISKETIANLQEVLSRADLIKFAKFKPLPNEIAQDRTVTEKIIYEIEKEIHRPILNEDGIDVEVAKKQAAAKKIRQQKTLKWVIGIVLVVGLLIGTGIHYGFKYLKDKVIGHSTLELLETKEWVKSDYGYPPVQLETPRLLQYEKPALPSLFQQAVDEASSFKYGTLRGGFGILVTTMTFKQPITKEDTEAKEIAKALAQGELMSLIKNGFKIDLNNVEEKEIARNDKNGYELSSVYEYENPLTKETEKYTFTLIQFANSLDAQSVVVAYQNGDTYGEQVAQRVLDSFVPLNGELIKAKEEEDNE